MEDTPGLLHYWRLSETSGTSFADTKGSATATTAGGPTLGVTGAVSGDSDLAARFDGTNDAASASVNLSGKTKLTVEFWLKWDPFANNDDLAMEFTSNFNSNAGGFLIDPNAPQSGGSFGVAIGDSTKRNNAYFTRPSAAVWHHYALVFDTTAAGANQITPYVDGAVVGYSKSSSSTTAGSFANSTLYFMSRAASSLFGNGDLDEVTIYDQALSADRIAEHYASSGTNQRPLADFEADPVAPVTGQQVTLDASASSDPDGTIEQYEWDLDGNGSFETDTEDDPEAKKTFSSVGDATVRLRVTDDDGGKDVDSLIVSVASPGDPPTASFTPAPNPVVAGQQVAFDAAASTDPDGTIAKYEWDLDGNGSYETDTGTKATTTHTYSAKSTITVALRVTDDDGQSATTTRVVSVMVAGSAAYPDAVTGTPGLLHYWRLGESSGTSLTDSVGSSTATTAGGATLGVSGAVLGDPSTAARFDGTNDAASASVNLSGTSKLTVEFWLKWNAFANDDDLAMELTSNFNSNAGGFLIDPNAPQSSGTFGVAIGNSANRNNAYFARPSVGAWHHYAFVFDTTAAGANQITPYVNGVPVSYSKTSSSTGAGAFANSTLFFMSRAGSSLFGAGDLDEVAIYGQALDADTITAHYESFGTNSRPDAAFDVDPSPAETGQEVEFDAGDSSDGDGTIAKYEWDLDGNGSYETDTGTNATTTHTYETPGERTIRLRVTDDDGGAGIATHKLQVDLAEQAPEAAFDASPNPILAGGTVSFDAGASDDADGSIVKYEWDLDGDGSFETDTGASATTSETYPDPGTVEVGLRVTDADDHTDTATAPVYVQASNEAYADTVFGTSGLAHYWRLGESTGTTLEDAKGSADATTSGSPTLGVKGAVAADADTAVSFDGSNDAASASVDLSATSTITVELWLKWDAFANNDALSLELTPNFNDNAGGLLIDPNAANGQFGVGIGKTATRNNVYFTRPSAEAWHHYAFVLDTTASGATQITPYVDGVAVGYTKDQSRTGSGAFANSSLNFMSRNATGLFGGGDLDELAIYTRALTSGEIEDHQAIGLNRPPVAAFTADPNPADVDEEAAFDASGSVDLDGTIAKYEWDLDGNGSYETDTGTTDNTSLSFTVAGMVEVGLRVTDDDGVTSETNSELVIGADPDNAPELIQTPEVWGAAMVGESLRARPGRWSTDTPIEWAFDWLRCDAEGDDCVAIEDPGAAPRLTDDDLGHRLRVEVTATNASGATVETSEATEVVVDTAAPEADALPAIGTRPVAGLPLVPGVTVRADADAPLWYPWLGPSVGYQWKRCAPSGEGCADILDATTRDYTLTEADEGKALRVAVTSTNRGGASTATSLETDVVHELMAPALDEPLEAPVPGGLVGLLWEGDDLFIDQGTWGEFSGPLSRRGTTAGRTYQWLRCDDEGESCSEIAGETGETYISQQVDDSSTLRVEVTATNAAGVDSAVSAASSLVLAPEAPEVEVLPYWGDRVFTESALHTGSELNDSAGGAYTKAFQWFRCDLLGADCTPIAGADGSAYTPTHLDVDHTLRIAVTAENRIDSDTATSDATPVVELALTPGEPDDPVVTPSPWGIPTLSDDPLVGVELAANDDGIWSPDMEYGVGREWQWQRCEATTLTCVDIPGAWSTVSRYYTPRWRDVGYRLRVRIARKAGHGQAWATSAMTGVVEAGAPKSLDRPSISGVPRLRDVLTTDGGTWEPANPPLDYQWLRCNSSGVACEEIGEAMWSTYEATAEDLGATLRVEVAGSGFDGTTKVRSLPTAVVGAASKPENVGLPYIEGDVEIGAELAGWEGTWTGAQPFDYFAQWLRCDDEGDDCQEIDGATDWWYSVSVEDQGATIRLEATIENDLGSVSARSVPSDVVPGPTAPVNAELPSITGVASSGETIESDEGEWLHYPTDFAYQWQSCDGEGEDCEDIEDATESSFQLRSADEDRTVRAVVTASNGGGDASAASEPTDVIGPMDPPENVSPPSVGGWPREGWEIKATKGSWSGGTPMTYSYQWLLCDDEGDNCADISGADERGYTPVAGDVENTLRVRVRATNDAGFDEATSGGLFRVALGEPRWAERVAVTGDPVEGKEVAADVDGLRGSAPFTFTYAWERCDDGCESIPGATDATYEAVSADVATRLRVVVTAENDQGEAVSKSLGSDPVDPAVVADAPKSAGRPTLSGLPRVTEVVESTTGEWRSADLITTTIQWQRCDDVPASCVDITGATHHEYTLDAADEGKRLRTVVEATNSKGTATAYSHITMPIEHAVNTTFVLDAPVTLAEVADAIEDADALLTSLDYRGEMRGSYSNGDGVDEMSLLNTFDTSWNADGDQLLVVQFTLINSIPTESLGSLSDDVATRMEVPSIWRTTESPSTARAGRQAAERDPRSPAPRSRSMQSREILKSLGAAPSPDRRRRTKQPARIVGPYDPYVYMANLKAMGADCLGDDCDDVDTREEWGDPYYRPEHFDYPRVVEISFMWRHNPNDLVARMSNEDRALAWEMDLKLHNGNNADLPFFDMDVKCLPWDKDDFWIEGRDNHDMFIDSGDIPDAAGFYWDTTALDSCDVKDLTFGLYHPENMQQGKWYGVTLYFERAGEEPWSTFSWGSTLLERRQWVPVGTTYIPCDFNPWCVNVPPDDDVKESVQFVTDDLDYGFPGCFEYDGWTDDDHALPCPMPTRARTSGGASP